MFDKPPKDYINLIISFLKDDSKIPKTSEETKELKVDIFSENMFEQLYHNLLYFYRLHKKKNIRNEIQKYFFSEIINILDIIQERSIKMFLENNFVKVILVYIVYSLNTPIFINPEIVLKTFFCFKDILDETEYKKYDVELSFLEKEIINTVKK